MVLMVAASPVSATPAEQRQHQQQQDEPLTAEEYYVWKAAIGELEDRAGHRMWRSAVRECKFSFKHFRPRWWELHREALADDVVNPVKFFAAAINGKEYLTEPFDASSVDEHGSRTIVLAPPASVVREVTRPWLLVIGRRAGADVEDTYIEEQPDEVACLRRMVELRAEPAVVYISVESPDDSEHVRAAIAEALGPRAA